MKIKFYVLSLLLITHTTHIQAQTPTYQAHPIKSINKVVIWGYKLHSHTHSYIHYAYYRAFKSLGYDTYWLDNKDDVTNFNFANSLFITMGEGQNLPLREDCRYILHNCPFNQYKPVLDSGNAIYQQVYVHGLFKNHQSVCKLDEFIFYNVKDKFIYMPWATDLLPHEIDEIKTKVATQKKEPKIYWIGSVWDGNFGNRDKLNSFEKAARENNISLIHQGEITPEDNISLIQKSFLAPAIQGKWQCEQGYIPCRIFKNISYGQLGITNNKTVYELFEGKIVYNENPYQLFYDAYKRSQNITLEEIHELMDFVKEKHTYINRINCLLYFLDLVKPLQ